MVTLRGSSFRPSFSTASKMVPPGTSAFFQVSMATEYFPVKPVLSTTGPSANRTRREAHSSVVIADHDAVLNPARGVPFSRFSCMRFIMAARATCACCLVLAPCSSAVSPWAGADGGSAGFSLGPFLPTTSAKPCLVSVSRCTEAFFEQRLQHGIQLFLRNAIGHLCFNIEALIGKPGRAGHLGGTHAVCSGNQVE